MENEKRQDFYWESPCEKCHYKKEGSNVSGWTALLLIMFVISFFGMFYFWQKSDALEKKLENALYITDSGDLHRVKDGNDSKIFDSSSFYEELGDLFGSFGDGFGIADE